MFWADQLIQNLDKKSHHRVDDMKTPSGHAHAGSLRAIATHGIVYEAMKKAGYDVDFTYVVNDMDPMDGLPVYLAEEEYSQHMGKPLFTIPAPDKKSESFAHQFAHEYIGAFNHIGFTPEILWSHELYQSGVMDTYIRQALDGVKKIREIYKKVADQNKPEGWYPFQVICPQCGKVGSSLVTDWDGTLVTYECKPNLVKWAIGCGAAGTISPFGGTGKLMWKVDWAAHWAHIGVTVEGAGKDHFSAGGSRYVSAAVMQEVFEKEPPFGFLHEFLLIGGAKMSSSKGNAVTAAELVTLLPPAIGKFLFVRTAYQRAINFDPTLSSTIPDLFDEYDRCAKAFFESGTETDMGRMYEAAQIGEPPSASGRIGKMHLPRFRQIATLIQMPSVDVIKFFEAEKGSALTQSEQDLLQERTHFARIWLEKYADEKDTFAISKTLPSRASELDTDQKQFLSRVATDLLSEHYSDGEALQQAIFELSKTVGLPPKKAFQAIYLVLINKDHGPKAGWLLYDEMQSNKDFLIERFTSDIA